MPNEKVTAQDVLRKARERAAEHGVIEVPEYGLSLNVRRVSMAEMNRINNEVGENAYAAGMKLLQKSLVEPEFTEGELDEFLELEGPEVVNRLITEAARFNGVTPVVSVNGVEVDPAQRKFPV